ncbi:MAG: phosphotransferase family protein [Acidobacteriota bacterium]|nr:phosphotransferase family protein [Acidobacteriota bacterium]
MTSEIVDTKPVRASEQLDWSRLEDYLRGALPECGRAPMQVEQFPGGHSNLTYLLRFGDRELVLRRPPFGPVPPRAHDMARECRLLQAVNPVFPLAPRPYLLCEDLSVAGFVFYVMERRRGIVIREQEPPELRVHRRAISEAMIDTLADLHAIDVAKHGLDALGKPAGFVARQIRGWTERWQGSKTTELPPMEEVAKWLDARIPADPPKPALVHGDYKLDNVMLDASAPHHLVAVFDWEMSAIGDPLVDLGIVLCYWLYTEGVTDRPGWFSREEILQRYAARAKRSVDNIGLYEVFAVFKLAVVLQQIYARYVRGQTDDPRFAALGDRVKRLAVKAASLAEELG